MVMTKEEKLKAFSMRLDGYSYQHIADELHCSRQNIYEMLNSINQKPYSEILAEICVYPQLKKYILEHGTTARNLYFTIYGIIPHNSTYLSKIRTRLSGKTAFTSAEWLKLAEITGIPWNSLWIQMVW